MGMVGARELAAGRSAGAPGDASTGSRLRAGVITPRLYLIPDGFPRALAGRPRRAGRRGDRALVGLLARRHHRPSSKGSSRTSSPTCGTATCSCRRRRDRRRRDRRGLADRRRLRSARSCSCSAPLAASFEHLVLSPKREFEADRLAADLCGSPHGLADGAAAPRAGDGARRRLRRRARRPSRSTRRIRSPKRASRRSSSRIRRSASASSRLRELDPDWREKLRAA